MPTLTREDLYTLVWTEPISRLAPRYGLSDRGLGKLCEREGIPVPPRGWWAKKAAGKRIPKQPELPPIQPGQHKHLTFGGPRPQPPAPVEAAQVPPEILFERQPENEIGVDPEGRITHPLVREAGIALRKAPPDNDGIRHSPRGCFDIRVSRDSIQRALLIVQALVRAAEHRSYGVEIKDGKTFVTVVGERLRIYLREGLKQEIRDLASDERERRRQGMEVNLYRRVPSGNLTFYEGEHHTTKSTGDSAKRRLEDALNVFIESLVRRAYEAKAVRAQREREAEARRVAEEKRQEAEIRNRHELARMERFDTLVEQWKAVETRRQFLAALRENVGPVEAGSPLADWLGWAEHYVERSSPLTRFCTREKTITVFYTGSGYEIADIRTKGFADAVPHVGYGEKPKPPGVRLADVPEKSGWASNDSLELALPEDVVLPYETTDPGLKSRRFCVPARVLNAILKP